MGWVFLRSVHFTNFLHSRNLQLPVLDMSSNRLIKQLPQFPTCWMPAFEIQFESLFDLLPISSKTLFAISASLPESFNPIALRRLFPAFSKSLSS